jgi:hypothetical protein
MQRFAIALLVVAVVLSMGSLPALWAAAKTAPPEPATKTLPPPPPTAAKAAAVEDGVKAAALEALLKDGKYDEAIDTGNKLFLSARDDDAKTTAAKVVAESLRKKGEWARTVSSYTRLRERFPKTADEWMLYDMMIDVMKASPKGVCTVGVPVATGTAAPDPAAKTVSDDDTLKEALGAVAANRMKTLKLKAGNCRTAGSAQAVVSALKPVADDAKRIRTVHNDVSTEPVQDVVTAAGSRLKDLAGPTLASLKNQYDTLVRPKLNRPWDFTNVDRDMATQNKTLCETLVQCEQTFQACISAVGSDSTEVGKKLNEESSERQQAFQQMSTQFVLPTYRYGYGYGGLL